MKKSNIDIPKLVEITTKYFRIRKIDPKKYPKLSMCKENIWRKITQEYFGDFFYKNELIIFKRFQRNTDCYANLVENGIKSDHLKMCNKENLQSIDIEFDRKDFELFKISRTQRKRLLVDFEQSLNEKLQLKGFNCYFECNYNWFKNEKSLNNEKVINWKGLYECIDPKCSNYIKPSIINQSSQIIQIKFFILFLIYIVESKNGSE